MELLPSKIVKVAEGQGFWTFTPFSNTPQIERKEIETVEVRLTDGREISADQRKKIYATLRDISLWCGHTTEYLKDFMKCDFIAKTGCEWFSLANVNMTTANGFLEHIIEFCLMWDVPCQDSLIDISPDISRYVYMCLTHKKCCISGKKAELHHLDSVGMGRDRKEIIHHGMRVLPLTRKYHTEAHTIGNESFCNKYHIGGVKLDSYLCGIWKIRKE